MTSQASNSAAAAELWHGGYPGDLHLAPYVARRPVQSDVVEGLLFIGLLGGRAGETDGIGCRQG